MKTSLTLVLLFAAIVNGKLTSKKGDRLVKKQSEKAQERKLWWRGGGKGDKKDKDKDKNPVVPPTTLPKVDFLEAKITSGNYKYKDLFGWVELVREDNGGKLIINYDIRNGPVQCNDCKLSIHHSRNCRPSELGWAVWDTRETENPWTVSNGAKYVTNSNGRSAGFIKIFNGVGLTKHKCLSVALFDSQKGTKAFNGQTPIACGILMAEGQDDC
eukprot:CAMPEP_0203697574 /NCGR_PEP_ID=MMETSP0091-20130426/10834_1 /ASSEMBLY_ACC=CAM_ASM_001089 /TAXON_ID=426623 /ORGANISM="Chaetoceros affinis, Strain CCMP159" /LENGTH=213 /DNA_ID=CAMNT_0050569605 /DNA_START=28 /DNA_END=669 /DNA_ORIENTATION=-